MKKIYFANDHAGYGVKQEIIDYLKQKGYEVVDYGANQEDGSVDYAPYAFKVSKEVVEDQALGVLVCGTGIGMSMAASKVDGTRVANIHNVETSELAKKHNNANVISLGARQHSIEEIKAMLDGFLDSEFEGERHERRINLISEYEKNKK